MSGAFQSISQSNNAHLASRIRNAWENRMRSNKWGRKDYLKESGCDIAWKNIIKTRLLPMEAKEHRTIVRYLCPLCSIYLIIRRRFHWEQISVKGKKIKSGKIY